MYMRIKVPDFSPVEFRLTFRMTSNTNDDTPLETI